MLSLLSLDWLLLLLVLWLWRIWRRLHLRSLLWRRRRLRLSCGLSGVGSRPSTTGLRLETPQLPLRQRVSNSSTRAMRAHTLVMITV